MSIATDITGAPLGNSATQLLELLANPDAYLAKLQAMEKATAEYKLYLEAVGPATEVLTLRAQATALRSDAEKRLVEAQAEADTSILEAQAEAEKILSDAKTSADALTALAHIKLSEAEGVKAQAHQMLESATLAKSDADLAITLADRREVLAKAAQEAAEAAKAEADALKADIIAKHQAFIQGL